MLVIVLIVLFLFAACRGHCGVWALVEGRGFPS